jgi:hypothetical protein
MGLLLPSPVPQVPLLPLPQSPSVLKPTTLLPTQLTHLTWPTRKNPLHTTPCLQLLVPVALHAVGVQLLRYDRMAPCSYVSTLV